MASLSSALFFNFGSYSPYMDISSYLSLSPTFPTFSHQSVCCKVFPVFPPRFSPIHFSGLFLTIFVARFSHQLFPNNPHLAILQRLLWSAGVRMGARREDKKILPIGEEDHLHCTHTPALDIRRKTVPTHTHSHTHSHSHIHTHTPAPDIRRKTHTHTHRPRYTEKDRTKV